MTAINNYYSPNNTFYYEKANNFVSPAFGDKQIKEPNSTPALERSGDKDTVEIFTKTKENKKGLSTPQKAGLTALGVLGGLTALTLCFAKHQTGKFTKLYNERMLFQTLPETLSFKEAKTVDEGIKFAKEVLKVGEVDKDFTLEAINYANKALVDVSNANKGKLFIPKKMFFQEMEGDVYAGVIKDIESPHFGSLSINKKYFDNKFMDKQLKDFMYQENNQPWFQFLDDNKMKLYMYKGVPLIPTKEVVPLMKKYYANPESLNITEKRNLWNSLCDADQALVSKLDLAPMSTIKEHKQKIEKALGLKIDLDEISKKTTDKQAEILGEWTEKLADKGLFNILSTKINLVSVENNIYHEMGHLQDFAKNLKELDLKHWKFSLKDAWKEANENVEKGELFKSSTKVRDVDNRWGGLTYDGYKELLEKNPKKFKAYYPDLHEFLTNQEIQQMAGKVSSYAQTSIGEFIADTYAKMVRGEKLPDDVIKLYDKYHGPKLAEF